MLPWGKINFHFFPILEFFQTEFAKIVFTENPVSSPSSNNVHISTLSSGIKPTLNCTDNQTYKNQQKKIRY
jgi:hypothetical protein